jgi:hypothetical protein
MPLASKRRVRIWSLSITGRASKGASFNARSASGGLTIRNRCPSARQRSGSFFRTAPRADLRETLGWSELNRTEPNRTEPLRPSEVNFRVLDGLFPNDRHSGSDPNSGQLSQYAESADPVHSPFNAGFIGELCVAHSGSLNRISTSVVSSHVRPRATAGRYFHCLTASIAAAINSRGPLTAWSS